MIFTMPPGTSTRLWRLLYRRHPSEAQCPVQETATRACGRRQGSGESDPFSRAPPRHVSCAVKKIARELKYFRRNRHRMRYAVLKKQGLPIGSGVTEAACKTLATQRMKRSGMRARRPSHSILPRSRAEQSLRASLDPARTVPTRRRLRLSTMSCRYAVGDDRCQYESYTQ